METVYEEYQLCTLCPRSCRVDRTRGESGVCRSADTPLVAHAMRHMWEEPCISGKGGSGTVFFSGCALGCVYCQNQRISRGGVGKKYSVEQLSRLYLSLEAQGVHNVNLVTAAHYMPHVAASICLAKEKGLSLPIVYNTSGYESVGTLRRLDGLVDIYLADFRYARAETARRYSGASDYPIVAERALAEMVRQCAPPVFDKEGLMRRGVIVRLLLLPDHLIEAKIILKKVFHTYGDSVYISLMSQYTPFSLSDKYPNLNRRVSETEYASLVEYARTLGVQNAFTQEGSAASENFIPEFEV